MCNFVQLIETGRAVRARLIYHWMTQYTLTNQRCVCKADLQLNKRFFSVDADSWSALYKAALIVYDSWSGTGGPFVKMPTGVLLRGCLYLNVSFGSKIWITVSALIYSHSDSMGKVDELFSEKIIIIW